MIWRAKIDKQIASAKNKAAKLDAWFLRDRISLDAWLKKARALQWRIYELEQAKIRREGIKLTIAARRANLPRRRRIAALIMARRKRGSHGSEAKPGAGMAGVEYRDLADLEDHPFA